MPNPKPRPKAESDLERADPLHTSRIGILFDPVAKLTFNLVQVGLLSGEQPGLRESHQILVAIDLPDQLVVANLSGVEEGNAAQKLRFAPLSPVDVVTVPANLVAELDLAP